MTVSIDTPGPGGSVLTVGPGMVFSSLADAIAAAQDNDVIAVMAGTYIDASSSIHNDVITAKNVTIEGVGGMAHLEMGPQGLANGKALLDVTNGLTLKNFELSGANDGNIDGNLAGIRLEGGNLTVVDSYIHNNEDGILGGIPGETVSVDHSEFAYNGAGDGYSHNVYIGPVDSFTLTNSYSHGANVGHEVKSRAAVTNIINNVIADGPTGTASYDIDIPNGGVAMVSGNIIEKGPMASNGPMIHYGGETQYSFPNNSLTVENNTIVSDYGPTTTTVILNQDAVNGLTTVPNLINNVIYGVATSNWGNGPVNESGNTVPDTEPAIPTTSPWVGAPIIAAPTGALTLTLTTLNNTVYGGVNPLTVMDVGGGNTIDSFTGVGVTVVSTGNYSTINTSAGTTNTITLGSRNNAYSGGADTITVTGTYDGVDATGLATITATSSAFSSFVLEGEEVLNVANSSLATVSGAANAIINDFGGLTPIVKAAGGKVAINQTTSTGLATVTVSGGADSIAAQGNGIVVNDTDTGAHAFSIGSGEVTVTAGSGADTFLFTQAAVAGSVVINGFQTAIDQLNLGSGVSATTTVSGGDTLVTLSDGRQVRVVGVTALQVGGMPMAGVLNTTGNVINTGTTGTTIIDNVGSNTINGGSGGMTVMAAGSGGLITTAAGSSNEVVLNNSVSTVLSRGTDTIVANGVNDTIQASGAAQITNTGNNSFVLNGADSLTSSAEQGSATVGAGGTATINVTAGSLSVQKSTGGTLAFGNGGTGGVTVSGGATTLFGSDGTSLSTHVSTSGGVNVALGGGSATITGGAGNDSIAFGSGSAVLSIASGSHDLITFVAGKGGGHETVYGYQYLTDRVQFQGFTGNPIATGHVAGWNDSITLTDGTSVIFMHVAKI